MAKVSVELGGGGAGPEGRHPGLLERVDEAGDQGRLGADRNEVDAALLGQGDDRLDVVGRDLRQALGVGCDAGVAGSAEQLGGVDGTAQRPDDRMLAPTTTDHERLQRV